MGRPLLRRSVTIAAAAGLWVASGVMPAEAVTYRAASTEQISDPVGDAEGRRPVPVPEPRADLTGARAIVHGDGRLELTATVAQPTDPATDPGWADAGAGLMWAVDTNGNDPPEYLVLLGNFPEGNVLVLRTDTFEPVADCLPAANYSPARYSVTLPASCLGTLTSFRWNVIMGYDANHADDVDGAMDSAPGGPEELTAGPATVTDPTGDVTIEQTTGDPRADITAAGATYETGGITLTASLASPTDPRLDPGWADVATGLMWLLDTNGDGRHDVYVHRVGPDLAFYVTDTSLNELCTGSTNYSPAGYSITFDPACIGSPASFTWTVGMSYGDASGAVYDTAPDTDLGGPVTAPGRTADPKVRPSGGQSGYWMMTDAGDVYGFGAAGHFGNEAGGKRVDIEPTPGGNGYWLLAASGSLSAKGDARHLGDAAGRLQPGEQAAALSATPNGDGYWIFTDRGRVLSFGSAAHFGDMAGTRLNGPVLDSVATPTGRGYWMVASDGGIFSFGDATFSGSTGDLRLNQPVMSMAADPDGRGYWLVASDGGIFAFDAPFHGSMGATRLNKPISGIVPGNTGYLMVGEDGGIFAFGDVAFQGSLGANPPTRPVVAVALMR